MLMLKQANLNSRHDAINTFENMLIIEIVTVHHYIA